MSERIGKNTLSGDQLRGFVERVEAIDQRKKELGADRAMVMAEARSQGFEPKGIQHVVKIRRMKPHDRAEADALADLYLHAMGLDQEPPLFRAMGLAAVDIHARESVTEALKKFVPAEGEIVIKIGKVAERLWRDKEGTVFCEPVKEAPAPTSPKTPARSDKPPAPDVDDAGAIELGRQAARDNKPVIENPFPFGDSRRARFDEGWRAESGGDGMGPDD